MAEELVPQGNETTLEKLMKKMMDVEGYVIFSGVLTNKMDEQGNRLLEFDYNRYHFSDDDLKATLKNFVRVVTDDLDNWKKELTGLDK